MAKKRVPKGKIIVSFLAIFISIVLITSVANRVISMIHAKRQYEQLVVQRDALKKERKNLDQEVKELNNDEYVVRYARDNYIFSKDGEKAVIVPEE